MQYRIIAQHTYSALEIDLDSGQRVVGDAGAMAWMSANIRTETTTRGGVLRGLKRAALSGESFFQNTYHAENGPGQVTFAPGSSGDIATYELAENDLILEKGAYLASAEGVHCDAKWDGFRGLFNEGMFVLRVTGSGTVFFHSYGRLEEVHVDGDYVVDNGFAVAWEPTLQYGITRARRIRSFLFSDQLLLTFQGSGRLWLQSRSPRALASWVYPFRRVQKQSQGD
jgi:uncharacterized protein (TIGR00266 family)